MRAEGGWLLWYRVGNAKVGLLQKLNSKKLPSTRNRLSRNCDQNDYQFFFSPASAQLGHFSVSGKLATGATELAGIEENYLPMHYGKVAMMGELDLQQESSCDFDQSLKISTYYLNFQPQISTREMQLISAGISPRRYQNYGSKHRSFNQSAFSSKNYQ